MASGGHGSASNSRVSSKKHSLGAGPPKTTSFSGLHTAAGPSRTQKTQSNVFNLTQQPFTKASVSSLHAMDQLSPPHLINQPLNPLWQASNGGVSQNAHDSLIENLSTLRASDLPERERSLLDKVRQLKQENKELVRLLKDNEGVIAEKIARQKRETDAILGVLGKLWPALSRAELDTQQREALGRLSSMVGKEVPAYEGGRAVEMMRKENEFLRAERGKERRDAEILRRQLEVAHVKQEMVFRQMLSRITALEEENARLSGVIAQMNGSVAKVLDIES